MSLFTDASAALWSYVKGQLTEQAEDKFEAARDRSELERDVKALAQRYQERFETLSLTEEFDFEGLNTFLTAHLWKEVSACFNAPKRDQREAARRMLFHSACYHAGADTQAKKDTVQAYLRMVLEVVERHFLEQVDGKEWFLCGRTVDETVQAVEAFLQQYAAQITEQITAAIQYHNSFEEYIDNLQPAGSHSNRFHYRNTSLGFYGREQEIAALNAFLDRDGDILWMAVTGDGGVGKSKLLYHFCAQVSNRPGWKTVWLNTRSSKRLNEYRSWDYPQRLLVVADYAGEMAEQLGDWLCNLSDSHCCPHRLRLILLEREPLGKVTPFWYQTFTGGRERRRAVERYCADPTNPCLDLEGPGDEALKRMVTDYAHGKDKPKGLTEDKLAFVLEKAREIDHGNSAPRPLITLFIADAVLDGKEYTHWDMKELLENIIKRYREYWLNTVCNGNEQLFNALEKVLVYATAVGGWDLTRLPGPLEEPSRTLRASRRTLEQLVRAVNEEQIFRGRLSPLEPDLVGEFYVLYYLDDKLDDDDFPALVQVFWERKWEFAAFLNRCIQNYQNYCKEERFQALFQDGLAALQPKTEDTITALFFAMPLANLTIFQSLEEAALTVGRLKTLAGQYSGSGEIILAYAVGLFNLSNKQSSEAAARTVDILKELAEKHSGSDEIALEYARGLVNLSAKQSSEKAAQTVDTLKELAEKHSGSDEIVLQYAMSLVNRSAKQSPEAAAGTVDKLEALAGQHSGSDEIALTYAQGLFNLSCDQSLEVAAQTIDSLKTLAGQHSGSDEIALQYAKGLFNLSNKQSLKEATRTVNKLKKLSENHSDFGEIALEYAKGLYNLSCDQSPKEAVETINELEALAGQYPCSDEITLRHAWGVANLIAKQSPEVAAQTIDKLKTLAGQHPGSDEIVLAYASGMVNLSYKQSQEAAALTVGKLEALAGQYPKSDVIALRYVRGLFNLSIKQSLEEAMQTINKIEKLAEQYPDSDEIALEYAKSLFNLSLNQSPEQVVLTIHRLEALVGQHSDSDEIAIEYARGLFNLTCDQSPEETACIVCKLAMLAEQHPDSDEIALRYAREVVNLIAKQSSRGNSADY